MEKKLAKIKGIVVSDKMDKTVIIGVDTLKNHPKYQKKYKVTKRYKIHDPENKYKIGDAVEFVQCKPISKEKRFKIAR